MSASFGFDGYGHVPESYNEGDRLLNEIHYLREKVKSTEEKQTEQEYWNKLLASNIRSGTMACMWCLKAQVLKKLSLAFYKWKYTSIMTNPSHSRNATPLKHRISSSIEPVVGNVAAALSSAMQHADEAKSKSSSSVPLSLPTAPIVSSAVKPEKPTENLSIMSNVMDIQYNSANSAHLNRYLQDTLSDKTTDFDTKRKILLAMSNDIIERGQRDRSSHTPDKVPQSPGSVHSRQSLSTIRSDVHFHQQPLQVRPATAEGSAQAQQQRSSLHELARSDADGHQHQQHQHHHVDHHNLSLDLGHVGGSNAQPLVSRSRSNSMGSSGAAAGGAAAAAANRGYSFNRSPARGRWSEHDPAPEHRPAPGDFKYLVFKNNDSGNYVKELLASPTLPGRDGGGITRPQRSSSANRAAVRTPPAAAAHQRTTGGGGSVASGGSHSANFIRHSADHAVNTSSSASVSSRSKHDVRHRINTLENSRLSANTSHSSMVPRYMLPTNTYIKKVLSPEEAAQFTISGHNMSGGMNRRAHKVHQQQKSMVSKAARYQHEREHNTSGGVGVGGGVGRNDTFNYSGSPYKGELEHQLHHHHQQQATSSSAASSPKQTANQDRYQQHQQPMPYLDSYIPQSERDRQAWPNEPADTPPSSAIAAAVAQHNAHYHHPQHQQRGPPVHAPPHMSDATHRVLRQPHFVTAAMEQLTGGHPNHHLSVNYDDFYAEGNGTHTLPTAGGPGVDSPHVQEYADLVYSSHPTAGVQQTQPLSSTESAASLEGGGGGGLFGSYADSRGPQGTAAAAAAAGADGYGFTYSAQRNERGDYVTSAGYHHPSSSSGGVPASDVTGGAGGGGSYSPGGHYYSHNDNDHYEGDYEEVYRQQNTSNTSADVSRHHVGSRVADSGTYYDEGHDVSSSNTSYQSYQLNQSRGGGGGSASGRRVFDVTKKRSPGGGGGGSVGGGSNSKGKKSIDKAQMKLFYGHLSEMKDAKESWSRTLRM